MLALAFLLLAGAAHAFYQDQPLNTVPVQDPELCKSGYYGDGNDACKYYQCLASKEEAYERYCWGQVSWDNETCTCVYDAVHFCGENEEYFGGVCEAVLENECCQPCADYDPVDCTKGPGHPVYSKFTWLGGPDYEYCGKDQVCPDGQNFDVVECRCILIECDTNCLWFNFSESCLSTDNGVENGIIDCSQCNRDATDGLVCSGDSSQSGDNGKALLNWFIKIFFGRVWCIQWTVSQGSQVAGSVIASNGNAAVQPTIVIRNDGVSVNDPRGNSLNIDFLIPAATDATSYAFYSCGTYVWIEINGEVQWASQQLLPGGFWFSGNSCPLRISNGAYLNTLHICQDLPDGFVKPAFTTQPSTTTGDSTGP